MRRLRWLALVLVLGLVAAACGDSDGGGTVAGGDDTPTTTAASEGDTTDTTEAMTDDTEATTTTAADTGDGDGDTVQVRWFVGLGAGSDAAVIPAQEAVVEAFNESQDGIELVLEIVDNDQAYNVLNTQLAAGEGPDIVGPLGIRGRDQFPGAWLDLAPLIDSTGYDLSDFDQELIDFYRLPDGQQLGLPFGVFPQFMYYNVDLFDEAGLAYPPAAYGDPYVDADGNEKPWDIDTVRELAQLLTVDANGNDATSPDFDQDNIVQFGFGNQWTDLRGINTLFGPGTFVDDDGNAVIPDHWPDATKWYHDLAWEDNTYPFADYGGSDLLNAGNWFESGNMAMDLVHLWYATCCVGGLEAAWNVAPVPSANGQTTAKLHADTFAITKGTDNPEASFEVLTYLLGPAANELLQIYGGMPARNSLQDGFFDQLDEGQFAGMGINWDVVVASLEFNDNPNHESGLPNAAESEECYNRISNRIFIDPDYDIDAAYAELQTSLQAIYDGTGSCTLEA